MKQAGVPTPVLAMVLMALAFGMVDAEAQTTPTVPARTAQSQVRDSADVALDERLAKDWGLRPEEWARYRQVMQGPLGIYSPNLDPLTALGIEARSDEEPARTQDPRLPAGL